MKVECTVAGYHPATGLDLVVGPMDVTEEQAAQLERAGFLAGAKKKRAPAPDEKKEG